MWKDSKRKLQQGEVGGSCAFESIVAIEEFVSMSNEELRVRDYGFQTPEPPKWVSMIISLRVQEIFGFGL